MEAWIQQLITQSLEWALFAVALVTFLESLALVGLLLPGTVMKRHQRNGKQRPLQGLRNQLLNPGFHNHPK